MIYDLLVASTGIALLIALWCAVQALARRYMPGCRPGQDLLDRPCTHCGHQGHGCGLGRTACLRD